MSVSAIMSAWQIKMASERGGRWRASEEKRCEGDRLGRKTERDIDRTGQKYRWRGKEKGGKESVERKMRCLGNTLHYNALLLQLCYLHSNNGGLAPAGQLVINNRTGEWGGSWGGGGGGVLSLSRPGMLRIPSGPSGILGWLNPSPPCTLQPQKSQCCLSPPVLK